MKIERKAIDPAKKIVRITTEDERWYALTKKAAEFSYCKFLDDLGITKDDYEAIKIEWKEKLGIVPYV